VSAGTWILLFVVAVGIGIAIALVNPRTPSRSPRTSDAGPKAAPGWYAEPTGADEQRYWDGDRWTDRVMRDGQESRRPLGRGIGRLGGGRLIPGPPGRPRPPTRP
jgi:hypothetical protein